MTLEQTQPLLTTPPQVEVVVVVVVVVVGLGFMTRLTSHVISVDFYSECGKSDKFCSEVLLCAVKNVCV